jgi:pimeloyl-ACP methyl ester carboxylesterase
VVGGMSPHALVAGDGVRLAARWWRPRGAPDRGEAVVVVHGFCSSKDAPAVELIALRQSALGRRVLTFDLRGHGGSGGATTLGRHEGLDVDAAVAAARLECDRVVVVGSSMGGVATIEHLAGPDGLQPVGAAARPVDGVRADGAVIVATPARWQVPRSTRGILALAMTQTRAGRAVTARRMGTRVAVRPGRGREPVVRVGMITRPVAVLHGLADRFVGPGAARTLYDALTAPRLLDLVPGMGHGFCPAAAEPIDDAVGWVMEEATTARPHAQGSAPG